MALTPDSAGPFEIEVDVGCRGACERADFLTARSRPGRRVADGAPATRGRSFVLKVQPPSTRLLCRFRLVLTRFYAFERPIGASVGAGVSRSRSAGCRGSRERSRWTCCPAAIHFHGLQAVSARALALQVSSI